MASKKEEEASKMEGEAGQMKGGEHGGSQKTFVPTASLQGSGAITYKPHSAVMDRPSSSLSHQKYYDVCLVALASESKHFQKMKDIIQRNKWTFRTTFFGRIKDVVRWNCACVVVLITEEDEYMGDLDVLVLTLRRRELAIIHIISSDEARVPMPFWGFSSVISIHDKYFEERLRARIAAAIMKRRLPEKLAGASLQSYGGSRERTGESSQRPSLIRLEKYDIEVQVPPNSGAWGVKDITVRAITEVPAELEDLLKEDQAIICVGLEMSPSNAEFSTPVKVTMPHSAIFKHHDSASVGMYYRKSSADRFSFTSFADGNPRCLVREQDLDLYIDHFSEWWIIAFIWRVFIGKRVICTPYVPISTPRNARHLLYLCIRDRNHGTEAEKKAGYTAPIEGEPFFIAWRSGDLTITCKVDEKEVNSKKRAESLFKHSAKMNVQFLVDTTDTMHPEVFVQFILQQSATIDLICPIKFSGLCIQSSEDLVTAAASLSLSTSISRGVLCDDPVPDGKLDILSSHVPHGKYSVLCEKLGTEFNEATTILASFSNNYQKAIRQCLADWKNKTSGSVTGLKTIICDAELGNLMKYLK